MNCATYTQAGRKTKSQVQGNHLSLWVTDYSCASELYNWMANTNTDNAAAATAVASILDATTDFG